MTSRIQLRPNFRNNLVYPFIFAAILSCIIILRSLQQYPTISALQHQNAIQNLPSPVSKLVKYFPPRPLPVPDWTTPTTIAAHVRHLRKGKSILTIITTGTDAAWFERPIRHAGCAVGDKFHHSVMVQPELVACLINASLPVAGEKVAALLVWDDNLNTAINASRMVKGVTFEISPNDIQKSARTFEKPLFLRQPPQMDAVAILKSHVLWSPDIIDNSLPETIRYELCMMTQIKYDQHLIPDYLAYYRRMGVDRFYLYDNNSPNGLDQYANHYTEIVHWPWNRSQFQAHTHFVLASRSRCRYAAFFDLDEYVFIGGTGPSLLKRYVRYRSSQGYPQILFMHIMMAGAGHIQRPWGSLPELYTRVRTYQKNFGMSTTIQTNHSWTTHRVNRVFGGKLPAYENRTTDLSPTNFQNTAVVIHYVSRSWEEFVDKAREGNSNIFLKYFYNAVLDASNPQRWFLTTEYSWEMTQFRTFWRSIRALRDTGEVTLTWDSDGKRCFRIYCPTCLFTKLRSKKCRVR